MTSTVAHVAMVLTLLGVASAVAHAQTPPGSPATASPSPSAPPAPPSAVEQAALAYDKGLAASKDGRWADALAAFEVAATKQDNSDIQYNIGVCLMALRRYVAARERFRSLLLAKGITPTEREDWSAKVKQAEQAIVRVVISLDPSSAALLVDGRPLQKSSVDGEYLSGVAPPGDAVEIGRSKFTMLIDPGDHSITAKRSGRKDVFVQETYLAGAKEELSLQLNLLPATINVTSDPVQSIVRVGEIDVGPAPTKVSRPAGTYKIEVLRPGYETFVTTLNLQPGERSTVTAKLVPDSVVRHSWFWWMMGGVAVSTAAGVSGIIYLATRPPPDYLGGTTHWVAPAPAAVHHW